jgi:hypothetical protein
MPDARSASAAPAHDEASLHASLDDACYHATDGIPATLLVIGVDCIDCDEPGGADGAVEAAVREAVLRTVSATVRGTDAAKPMESGEVAVLLTGAGLVPALGVGERVLRALREVRIPTAAGEARVHASAGLASTEEGILDSRELCARAAAALATARRDGGDRAAVWAEAAQPASSAAGA